MSGYHAKDAITFNDLGISPPLVQACESIHLFGPSDFHIDALRLALSGKDLVILTERGYGKPRPYDLALPILQGLQESLHPFVACVITCSRNLAVVCEHLLSLGAHMGLRCVTIAGKDWMRQILLLGSGPHVVVGTPNKLLEHLDNNVDFSLGSLKYLILDEADEILNQWKTTVERIFAVTPSEKRTYSFSTAMTFEVEKFQSVHLRNPVEIGALFKVNTFEHRYCLALKESKDHYLYWLLNQYPGYKTIVFTSDRNSARQVAGRLKNLGFSAVAITGKKKKSARVEAWKKLGNGQCDILVSTDGACMEPDASPVGLIINYHVPISPTFYMHRVVLAKRSAIAFSLVDKNDEMVHLQRIKELIEMHEHKSAGADMLAMSDKAGEAKRLLGEDWNGGEGDGAKGVWKA